MAEQRGGRERPHGRLSADPPDQRGRPRGGFYDLFVLERAPGVDLLVRAMQDCRLVAEDPAARKLRAAVAACPVAAAVPVAVPCQGARAARQATLAVRFCPVVLRAPPARAAERLPDVALWAVWAHEVDAPAGAGPLDWLLLTTAAVQTAAAARERLAWYACRWGIEVFHKVLKSGCSIERRQLEDLDYLQRCLTLYSVIAWHVLYATLLSRVGPDLPCTTLLEESEWQALYCHIHHTTVLPDQSPPGPGGTLDCPVGRLSGPRERRPPRRHRALARLPAPDRSHRHVPHLPSSLWPQKYG